MPAILIDYEKIVKRNNILKNFSQPPKTEKGFSAGLILILQKTEIEKISNLPSGKTRIEYIDNLCNVLSKPEYLYILYNSKKHICIIDFNLGSKKIDNYIQDILYSLYSGLDKNTILWIAVPLEKNEQINLFHKSDSVGIKNLIQNGFNSPYITNLSPLAKKINISLALTRENIPTERYSTTTTLNKISNILKQYRENTSHCSLYAKFSRQAISFLKQTSKIGFAEKEKQVELTGELHVSRVIKKDSNIVYIIDVNEGSIESGEEENVDVSATRYNFHSHPEQAYIRHSVVKAWPSSTDYLGYLKLGRNTIFHCVSTLEGLYIMSFSSHWGSNIKHISKSFIEKNYNIDHKEHYTPREYIDKVNNILFKGYPIYNLQYLTWEGANTPFKVFYSKNDLTCIPTEHGMKTYKKIN